MTKKPQYPISPDQHDALSPEKSRARDDPPPGLYAVPSFKFRHEVREPLENGETSYRRAYPQFFGSPRRRGLRRRGV
jgi:hypothetical protein